MKHGVPPAAIRMEIYQMVDHVQPLPANLRASAEANADVWGLSKKVPETTAPQERHATFSTQF
jgi:hypothetical protein